MKSLNVLDSPAEERFDRVTRMAKRMFRVPIALVSIVDGDRQWCKSMPQEVDALLAAGDAQMYAIKAAKKQRH
ncbi:hypothetical protein [Duganella lactea]|uniref:hypothetical protein n=1 Tax=Duganella lactea TaxID=2692173 RepID=UPI0019272090|nr:hypothetical protein [Duganella lactea]